MSLEMPGPILLGTFLPSWPTSISATGHAPFDVRVFVLASYGSMIGHQLLPCFENIADHLANADLQGPLAITNQSHVRLAVS